MHNYVWKDFRTALYVKNMYATFSYDHYTQIAIMKRTSQSENCMHIKYTGLCENLAKD